MSCDYPDRLTATAAAALAAGMSYGKYVARYGVAPVTVSEAPEPDETANLIAVCPECGVRFLKPHGNRKYCCRECYSRHSSREATRRYRERQAAAKATDGGDDD